MAEDSIQVFVSPPLADPHNPCAARPLKKALERTSGPRTWDRRLSLRSVVAPQGFFKYVARVFI